LIYTFCERLHHHIPVSVHRHACENSGQDSSHSCSCTNAHRDVDGHPRALDGEDPPILEQNRQFSRHQTGVVGYDTEEEILDMSESHSFDELYFRTLSMWYAFSIGKLIKCLPFPYLAPWIRQAEVHIEKT
jgi:hypothetical protein